MSGVKRDCDLGIEFEFGASKRKIKAESERKNLELSWSLLKLLKRNDDASVSDESLGENVSREPVENTRDSSNDEIEREYKATAEATYLKGSASVKDHDASAMGVGNQHKTLEKLSGSYD
jgi:hypothetical protein